MPGSLSLPEAPPFPSSSSLSQTWTGSLLGAPAGARISPHRTTPPQELWRIGALCLVVSGLDVDCRPSLSGLQASLGV